MKLMEMLMVGALVAVPVAQADTYEIDASHSGLGFATKHMVISTVRGSFEEFTGSFEYDGKDAASLKASATIKTASIGTKNAKRDDHLRSPDFFDATQFPEITFVSTRTEATADGAILHGNLTMRGVTKEIALPVVISGPVTDPWGKSRVGLEGKAKINRKDWGINWSKSMDNGGLVVSDDVTLEIAVEGIKK